MAEGKKKSSWEIPPPGPGTISGFFVAWLFVGAIIGIIVILMAIGAGPMPMRVVAYDLELEGKAPAEVPLDKLVSAIKQTSPMVLVLRGISEELAKELGRKLEMKEKNVLCDGRLAILSKYAVVKGEGGRLALIRFGKRGNFGIVQVGAGIGAAQSADIGGAADLAVKEFDKVPHAIFVSGQGDWPRGRSDYVAASARNKAASHWRILVPEAIKDKVKDCYVPIDNKAIKDFSDRLPLIAHFVFRKEDFE